MDVDVVGPAVVGPAVVGPAVVGPAVVGPAEVDPAVVGEGEVVGHVQDEEFDAWVDVRRAGAALVSWALIVSGCAKITDPTVLVVASLEVVLENACVIATISPGVFAKVVTRGT